MNAASFIVRPVGGQPLPGKYGLRMGVVNFDPDQDLQPGTTYEVVLPKGGVADLVGNTLADRVEVDVHDELERTDDVEQSRVVSRVVLAGTVARGGAGARAHARRDARRPVGRRRGARVHGRRSRARAARSRTNGQFGEAATRARWRPDVPHLHGARPLRRPGRSPPTPAGDVGERVLPAPRPPPADARSGRRRRRRSSTTPRGTASTPSIRTTTRITSIDADTLQKLAELAGLPQAGVARADARRQALGRPPGRLRRRRRRPGSIRRRARLSPALRVAAGRRRDEPHRRRRLRHA